MRFSSDSRTVTLVPPPPPPLTSAEPGIERKFDSYILVRTDNAIHKFVSFFYFEVKIDQEGETEYVLLLLAT